jgi:hypothetical protein
MKARFFNWLQLAKMAASNWRRLQSLKVTLPVNPHTPDPSVNALLLKIKIP